MYCHEQTTLGQKSMVGCLSGMRSKQGYNLFFDNEADKYDALRNFYEGGYGGMRERKLLSLFSRGKRVLYAACGTGRLLSFLTGNGYSVVGIDLSRKMLTIAKSKQQPSDNVNLIRCDAETMPFRAGVFDEVVCSRAFKLFPNPIQALGEWWRVLELGGKLEISLETSDPFWIRAVFKINPRRFRSARFEWRYRSSGFQLMLQKAGFKLLYRGCILYFGRSVYESAGRYLPSAVRFLEKIDSHCKIGRNVMFVSRKE